MAKFSFKHKNPILGPFPYFLQVKKFSQKNPTPTDSKMKGRTDPIS